MRTCRRLGIRTVAVCSCTGRAGAPRAGGRRRRPARPRARGRELPPRRPRDRGGARIRGRGRPPGGTGSSRRTPPSRRRSAAAGLAWIGPPPTAMLALGDKARAKALAEANGVPVLPGYHGDPAADEDLVAAAASVGFPVLLKASAGGGGRGMRVVRARRDAGAVSGGAERGRQGVRRGSLSSSGTSSARATSRSRCSPTCTGASCTSASANAASSAATRSSSRRRRPWRSRRDCAADGGGGVRRRRAPWLLQRGHGRVPPGAPTVSSIFLEMNTRIQVEHPVTELVYGVDLVREQLRIAAGERLGFGQADVRLDGHAGRGAPGRGGRRRGLPAVNRRRHRVRGSWRGPGRHRDRGGLDRLAVLRLARRQGHRAWRGSTRGAGAAPGRTRPAAVRGGRVERRSPRVGSRRAGVPGGRSAHRVPRRASHRAGAGGHGAPRGRGSRRGPVTAGSAREDIRAACTAHGWGRPRRRDDTRDIGRDARCIRLAGSHAVGRRPALADWWSGRADALGRRRTDGRSRWSTDQRSWRSGHGTHRRGAVRGRGRRR